MTVCLEDKKKGAPFYRARLFASALGLYQPARPKPPAERVSTGGFGAIREHSQQAGQVHAARAGGVGEVGSALALYVIGVGADQIGIVVVFAGDDVGPGHPVAGGHPLDLVQVLVQ